MITEIGHIALILALLVSVVQSTIPMVGAHKGWHNWMNISGPAAIIQCLLIMVSFAALTHAFVTSDFSVRLVATNSHSLKPMLYKVSGVWGNHEGSMLLWVLILALFGGIMGAAGKNLRPEFKARVLSIQGLIGVAFLLFILFTSNPFIRIMPAPIDGNDLNPLLQDPGLAFHPPFLYLGYVGLSMAFSFAVAALIEGRVDNLWARWVRPWTLAAWVCLTIGIALGSYWAYYELGWGGWWFWDPVENASFMPWLLAGALLHSAIVVEKRGTLKNWTILLAILAFSLSLMGTFIVRSGVITSVHAFASDPTRGVFILIILGISVGGSMLLYAWRSPQMQAEGVFSPISREGGILLNNLILSVSAAIVLTGTLYPLLHETLTGRKISVGEPYFDATFGPLMIPLILALPIGAMMTWKRSSIINTMPHLFAALGAAILTGMIIFILKGGQLLAPIGAAMAVWVIVGALSDIAVRIKLFKATLSEASRRAINLPHGDWGKTIAHMGFGLTILGICISSAWETEDIRVMQADEAIKLGKYELTFNGVERIQGPNYLSDTGNFLLKDGKDKITLQPEKRFYPVQSMPTTEAAIDSSLLRDVYIVLGDQQANGGWVVRSYVKPMINWIWIGSLVMALGGLISLTDRRLRIGIAKRAKQVTA